MKNIFWGVTERKIIGAQFILRLYQKIGGLIIKKIPASCVSDFGYVP